jgi:hypothetical protein
MKIWVDADACPAVIRELLYRAAERKTIELFLVANTALRPPPSKLISTIRVAPGLDAADKEIVRRMSAGDLIITQDIPLAAEVIEKGGHALNPRGEFYSAENIRSRLSMRNFLDDLRASGVETGGPAALNTSDRQRFANELDRFLTRYA